MTKMKIIQNGKSGKKMMTQDATGNINQIMRGFINDKTIGYFAKIHFENNWRDEECS